MYELSVSVCDAYHLIAWSSLFSQALVSELETLWLSLGPSQFSLLADIETKTKQLTPCSLTGKPLSKQH